MRLNSTSHTLHRYMRRASWLVLSALMLSALLAPAAAGRWGGPAFLVKDINTSTTPTSPMSGHLWALTRLGSTLYFVFDDTDSGAELWRVELTGAGAALVRDINPGPEAPTLTR